jgi:hypothetical protein
MAARGAPRQRKGEEAAAGGGAIYDYNITGFNRLVSGTVASLNGIISTSVLTQFELCLLICELRAREWQSQVVQSHPLEEHTPSLSALTDPPQVPLPSALTPLKL